MALSGSRDSTIKLWNIATGKEINIFKKPPASVSSVAFSPDGRRVLSNSEETIRLWDITAGEVIRTFEGHSDKVNSIAFSPDGRMVLSAHGDETIKL